MKPFVRCASYLATSLALCSNAFAQTQEEEEEAIVVRGRARNDGCVALEGTPGPHGLPEHTLPLRVHRFGYRSYEVPAWARRNHAFEEQATPRERLEAAVRFRNVALAEAVFSEIRSAWTLFHIDGRVRRSGYLASLAATMRSREVWPVVGRVIEPIRVEVRQCPVAYRATTRFGEEQCVGRRVQLVGGPSQGRFAGLAQSLVLDLCFFGPEQNEVVARSYLVRGSFRSFPPVFSETEVAQYVGGFAGDMVNRLQSRWETEAGLQQSYLHQERIAEAAPAAPELPVPNDCVAPIRAATERFLSYTREPFVGNAPSLAEYEAALHRFRTSVPAEIWQRSPWAEYLHHDGLPPSLAQPLDNAAITLLRTLYRGRNCSPLPLLGRLSSAAWSCGDSPSFSGRLIAPGQPLEHPYTPSVARRADGWLVRVCRTEQERIHPLLTSTSRQDRVFGMEFCAWTSLQQAGPVFHSYRRTDQIDHTGYDTVSVLLENNNEQRALPRFVREALARMRLFHCVPFVRPLTFLDTPHSAR